MSLLAALGQLSPRHVMYVVKIEILSFTELPNQKKLIQKSAYYQEEMAPIIS
jgi:hypothetical protein